MSKVSWSIAMVLAGGVFGSSADAGLELTGTNLSGAEFRSSVLPGVYNTDYTYPTKAEVDYFIGKGMNTFRIPFRWERMQRTLGGAFDTNEFNRLNNLVTYATSQGATVILDPHNYARYAGTIIGTGSVTNAHFADFWTRLAAPYKNNDKVIFGLVNEPHGMPSTEHWVNTANVTIEAIRNSGANNLILVPGNAYSGAHSWSSTWYGTPNAIAMKNIVDPGNNYAIEVHQYLDSDSSGTSETIVNVNIGAQRLVNFTNWARDNNLRAFLGEFGVANSMIGDAPDQIGDEALKNMLNYMETHSDVWMGFAWWSAGPWWGNYMFTIEPTNLGKENQADRPVMSVLQPYLTPVPEPTALGLVLAGGLLMLRRSRVEAAR